MPENLMRRKTRIALFSLTVLALPAARVFAAEPNAGHEDPVAPILVALILVAMAAALGGRAMRWIRQPAVLGELLVGMLIGNIGYWLGAPVLTVLRQGETIRTLAERALLSNVSLAQAARDLLPADPATERLAAALSGPTGITAVSVLSFLDLLSRIAIIVLLFLVGLETSVVELRRAGRNSLQVAFAGVALPFLLGLGVMAWMLPAAPLSKDLFIAGILTATSVGITARVLRDLGASQRTESTIILGAAVVDDVLGLLVLAVASSLVTTGTVSWTGAAGIILKATVFLAGSIWIGLRLTPRVVKLLRKLRIENLKLLFGVGFAMLLALLSNAIGMATIVGAFAAGLILGDFFDRELEGHSLRELLSPVESLIVPLFFVLMGLQVKLESLVTAQALLLAGALTVVAIAGKVAAGYACTGKLNRLAVGFGMMPRGEVGLIFAGIGKGLGVVSDAVFSAVVLMVMITTFLTPPLLQWALARRSLPAAS